MQQAITTTTDPAAGQHEKALLASNLPRWTTDRARQELGDAAPETLAAIIARIGHDLRPVPAEVKAQQAWRDAIDERLRRLAAKVAPGMAPSQTEEWRLSMADALADLPAMVSLTACKRAIHRPFRFLNEIEHAVREIADEIITDRESRRRAAERILSDLQRAVAQPPALPPVDDDRPITADEIRAMPPTLRAMGVKIGAFTDAAVAEALAEQA